jgi:hypothetical protein
VKTMQNLFNPRRYEAFVFPVRLPQMSAPSAKPALESAGSLPTEGPARYGSNDPAMKPPTRQMSGCGLFGIGVSERRQNLGRQAPNSGQGGIGRRKICLHAVGIPVPSLPVLNPAVILPISFPISRLCSRTPG